MAKAPAAPPYPRIELIRYLPEGEEAYSLRCQADATGTDRYVCRLSRLYNHGEIDGKWVYARTVEPLLARFEKELPQPLPAGASRDVQMRWEVQAGGKTWSGALAKNGRPAPGALLGAVLGLEADLATPFYR